MAFLFFRTPRGHELSTNPLLSDPALDFFSFVNMWECKYVESLRRSFRQLLILDRSVKRKKRKAGSNGSRYVEGWVEFRDKRVAKRVAASLHNTPMTNRKRSHLSSDLWCIKVRHNTPLLFTPLSVCLHV